MGKDKDKSVCETEINGNNKELPSIQYPGIQCTDQFSPNHLAQVSQCGYHSRGQIILCNLPQCSKLYLNVLHYLYTIQNYIIYTVEYFISVYCTVLYCTIMYILFIVYTYIHILYSFIQNYSIYTIVYFTSLY